MRPGEKSLVKHGIQQDLWAELKKGAEMFALRQLRDEDEDVWKEFRNRERVRVRRVAKTFFRDEFRIKEKSES